MLPCRQGPVGVACCGPLGKLQYHTVMYCTVYGFFVTRWGCVLCLFWDAVLRWLGRSSFAVCWVCGFVSHVLVFTEDPSLNGVLRCAVSSAAVLSELV